MEETISFLIYKSMEPQVVAIMILALAFTYGIWRLNKGKIILWVTIFCLISTSCSTKREGTFRRIKGDKVWIPKRTEKLDRRYEKCYF